MLFWYLFYSFFFYFTYKVLVLIMAFSSRVSNPPPLFFHIYYPTLHLPLLVVPHWLSCRSCSIILPNRSYFLLLWLSFWLYNLYLHTSLQTYIYKHLKLGFPYKRKHGAIVFLSYLAQYIFRATNFSINIIFLFLLFSIFKNWFVGSVKFHTMCFDHITFQVFPDGPYILPTPFLFS